MVLTLCTLNANGIRAAERRGFSRWLARRQPSILCLQEVRAQRCDVPPKLYSPRGYNTRWQCARKKGYAGVALWSHECADAYRAGSGLDWGDDEGRVLRADYPDLSVVSCYVPSGSAGPERQERKWRFLEHFLGYARALLAERRPIAMCGDFNIAHTPLDIHAPKRNEKNSGFLPEERAWFDALLAQGWVDVVRAQHPGVPGLYSWWSNRGRAREKDLGWRIDYVLADPRLAERVKRAWIEKKAGLADHAPVWVEIEEGRA
jgi:exodeoxyribonuclease-3